MDNITYNRYLRLELFLSKCIDSPDTTIRREATTLHGEISNIIETESPEEKSNVIS